MVAARRGVHYLEKRVGEVRLAVLHQRLSDEQDLRVSWRTFYRYVAAHWLERLRGAVRPTIRLRIASREK